MAKSRIQAGAQSVTQAAYKAQPCSKALEAYRSYVKSTKKRNTAHEDKDPVTPTQGVQPSSALNFRETPE